MTEAKYGAGAYPYLDPKEDVAFARAFRLTEDEFLSMCGGLRAYTNHRLNRDRARQASISAGGETKRFSIPKLPGTVEEAMSKIKLADVKPENMAKHILNEQLNKVEGVMAALKADREIKANLDRAAKDEQQAERRFKAARRAEYAGRYEVSEDSQSAQDYADQQWKIEQRKRS